MRFVHCKVFLERKIAQVKNNIKSLERFLDNRFYNTENVKKEIQGYESTLGQLEYELKELNKFN